MADLFYEIWESVKPWLIDSIFGRGGLIAVVIAAILQSSWLAARHWVIRKLAPLALPKVAELGESVGDSLKQATPDYKMPARAGDSLKEIAVNDLTPKATEVLNKAEQIIATPKTLGKAVDRAVEIRNTRMKLRSRDLRKPGTKGGLR